MQQALAKMERKDSTGVEPSTTTPTTPNRSGRKATTNSSKNYREETSEEEDDDGGGSPSKGRKGKIFKSKENAKDKRKSMNCSYIKYFYLIN